MISFKKLCAIVCVAVAALWTPAVFAARLPSKNRIVHSLTEYIAAATVPVGDDAPVLSTKEELQPYLDLVARFSRRRYWRRQCDFSDLPVDGTYVYDWRLSHLEKQGKRDEAGTFSLDGWKSLSKNQQQWALEALSLTEDEE